MRCDLLPTILRHLAADSMRRPRSCVRVAGALHAEQQVLALAGEVEHVARREEGAHAMHQRDAVESHRLTQVRAPQLVVLVNLKERRKLLLRLEAARGDVYHARVRGESRGVRGGLAAVEHNFVREAFFGRDIAGEGAAWAGA